MKSTISKIILLIFLCNVSLKAQENQSVTLNDTTALRKIIDLKKGAVEITALKYILSGTYTCSNGDLIKELPPFCQIAATLHPSNSSIVKMELWLPLQNWNGRFLGTGNGGGAGGIFIYPIADGLKRGFATANTDMGTYPYADDDDVLNNPEKWIDFGHRATHSMTVISKEMILAFYHKNVSYSYFSGCSTGGQQALSESQKYPLDYNGIIAGAPANNRTHLHAYFLYLHRVANNKNGKILTAQNFELLNKEIIKACSGKDGGLKSDNFLTDPRYCSFDPEKIPLCPDGISNENCITSEQLAALKKIYEGPINPNTGERIYAPPTFGSENFGMTDLSGQFYLFRWTFGKDFNYQNFDFDKDMQRVDELLAANLNANNPDLSPFKKARGKIIMYTGTEDWIVPYEDAVNYYERVIENQKGLKQTQEFFRYFLIPGMGHCGGGNGMGDCGQSLSLANIKDGEHDMLTALMKWVEKGTAPEKIIASSYQESNGKKTLKGQRPVFPYPLFPQYVSGDVNNPSNYKPVAHEKGKVLKPSECYLK